MDFKISFYIDNKGKSPVEEFLISLIKGNRILVVNTKNAIEKLRNRSYHREPLSKYIEPDLWELRVKSSTNILRIIYTFRKGQVIIMLHGFVKKKQKLSWGDLEIAKKRLKELKQRGIL